VVNLESHPSWRPALRDLRQVSEGPLCVAATFALDMLLEPRGQATAVTFDWTQQPKSLVMRLAAPFLRGTFERSTEELEGLKRRVEARARVPSESQA
jgi:hypothetical protein